MLKLQEALKDDDSRAPPSGRRLSNASRHSAASGRSGRSAHQPVKAGNGRAVMFGSYVRCCVCHVSVVVVLTPSCGASFSLRRMCARSRHCSTPSMCTLVLGIAGMRVRVSRADASCTVCTSAMAPAPSMPASFSFRVLGGRASCPTSQAAYLIRWTRMARAS